MARDSLMADSGEAAKLKGKIEALNVSTEVFLKLLKEDFTADKHQVLVSTLEKSLNQKQSSLSDDPFLKKFFKDKKQSILREVKNLLS